MEDKPVEKDDLISRAAALDAIDNMKPMQGNMEQLAMKALCWAAIKTIQPVDAASVVRGEWIKVHGFFTPGGDPVWACSKCGKGVHVYGIEHGTYGADIADGQWISCPNCGAKMDGERWDEDGADA